MSALLLGLVLLTSAPGSAHAEQRLLASDPPPRAELERAPGWVNLAFDSPVDAGIAKVLVLDADGKNVTTGNLIVEFNTITTQLIDKLPRGTYTVQYRADESGSPLGGSFQFSYGAGTFSPDAKTTWEGADAEPEIIKNPDPNATTSQSPPRQSQEPAEPPPVDPTQADPEPTAPDPSVSGSPTESKEGEPSQAENPSETTSSSLLPWIVGGAAAILVVVGAVLLYLRTRHGTRP